MTRPSSTCRRSGQREPQLTVQADQTNFESVLEPSAASAAPTPGVPRRSVPETAVVATAAPPTRPDHWRNLRRLTGVGVGVGAVLIAVPSNARIFYRKVVNKCNTNYLFSNVVIFNRKLETLAGVLAESGVWPANW